MLRLNFDCLRQLACFFAALSIFAPVAAFATGAGIGSYQCRHIAPKFYGDDTMVYNHLYEWISGYGKAISDTKGTDFGHTDAMYLMVNTMEFCQNTPAETVQSVASKLLETSQ